jgi:thioredoxin reductase
MIDLSAPIDVAVIGAGPSGLAAAIALKNAGVTRVVVLDRETQAGGVPRHCNHPPYGMREFGHVLKGPEYARRIVAHARNAGVEIHISTTVTDIKQGGVLLLSTPDGVCQMTPRRVVYATGVRETPRSGRLISGARVQGVVNTGTLQSMVYQKRRRPFRRPVIIGTELVAFSALMTCRAAGIRPIAMIEAGPSATARWPSALYPRLNSVKLLTGTRLIEIEGDQVVQSVKVAGPDGSIRNIECDGVILTGNFTPEVALARCGHLDVDVATGGPVVDQWGRCSDPTYFGTGNVLRPVETAGRSWAEGWQTGEWVAQDLRGDLPSCDAAPTRILLGDPRLKYAMPQLIRSGDAADGMGAIQLRVTERVRGALTLRSQNKLIWQQRLNSRPERRIIVPIGKNISQALGDTAEFTIEGCSA